MNLVCCVTFTLVLACSVRQGLGAASFTGISSGSVIADFEETVNAATLTCNVTNEGIQVTTFWSVGNFRGVSQSRPIDVAGDLFILSGDPRPNFNVTYLNRVTVSNFTSELDGVWLFCGVGSLPEQANVVFRIYRPPNLQDNFMLRIQEGDVNVPVDISQEPLAFPEPTNFMWSKDGESLRNGLTTTYSNVTFNSVIRSDSGEYTVFAANTLLDNTSQQIGNDTGSFYLNVLYPPTLTKGPPQRYVRLGDRLSLVCGTNLDSNPSATITWTAPDGTTVVDNARYDLENGPEIVRLNFTNTIMEDNGMWRCEVAVRSDRYALSGGKLVQLDNSLIGMVTVNIQLTVVAPPGQPRSLSVDSIGATWVRICWSRPLDSSVISRYEVLARTVDDSRLLNISTESNSTFFNVTGLLPATTYELSVVAVAEGGDVIVRSIESTTVEDTTGFTVPEIMCSPPQSINGVITANWSYVHTGGLLLTNVSANYSYIDHLTTMVRPVSVQNVNVTSVEVPGLVAGFMYTFTVTAENSNGSSTVTCGSVLHEIGVPVMPEFGPPKSGPGTGQVTLSIKTDASGVNNVDQGFRFVITPVLDGDRLDSIPYPFPRYESGILESITVSGLQQGRSYTFSATAVNRFGNSTPTNSAPVKAGGPTVPSPETQPPSQPGPGQTSDSNASVIGGAIGGVLAVVVIVAVVVIIIVALLLLSKGRGDYRPNKIEGGEYHLAPSSEPTVKVEEVSSVDIGEEVKKTKPDIDNEIQYAELESFHPPGRSKNDTDNATAIQPEEPVEYAVITTFKKADDPPASSVPAPTSPSADNDADDKTGTSTTLV